MIIASIGTKRPQAVNAVGVPNKDFCINDTFILLNYIWQAKAETFQDPKIKIKLFKTLIGCEF